jgi:predicted GNAT family acetyltransferase
MSPSDITLSNKPDRHRYELSVAGRPAAFLNYKLTQSAVNLVHTEVLPEHEGKGLGARLAKFALDDARAQGRKVQPSCSFVAGYIQRHAEYKDLLAPTSSTGRAE